MGFEYLIFILVFDLEESFFYWLWIQLQIVCKKNWIPSNPEKEFFAYLRLYRPLENYDKSWKMPDVVKVEQKTVCK